MERLGFMFASGILISIALALISSVLISVGFLLHVGWSLFHPG